MALKLHDTEADFAALREFVTGTGVETALERAGTWLPVEFSKTRQTRTLRFMVNPEGTAVEEIRRNADGTVSVTSPTGNFGDETPLFHDRSRYYEELYSLLHREIFDAIAFRFDPQKTAAAFTSSQTPDMAVGYLRNMATQAAQEAAGQSVLPSGRRSLEPSKYRQATNRLIREQILNREVMDIASRFFRKSELTASLYNAILSNIESLTRAADTIPETLAIAAEHLPVEVMEKSSPEEIESAVSTEMGLSAGTWPIALDLMRKNGWRHMPLTQTGAAARSIAELPPGPNTEEVAEALSKLIFIQSYLERLPLDTVRQWTRFLETLCTLPGTPAGRQTGQMVEKYAWKLSPPVKDRPEPRFPQTWEECRLELSP